MTWHALLLLPLLAPSSARQALGADPDGWVPFVWVEVQAGDEMITSYDVDLGISIARERRGLSLTTRAERDRLYGQTREELVLMALESQAAEDQEQSPVETVDRFERWLEEGRRDKTLMEYEEELQASGVSPLRYREQQLSQFRTSTFRHQGKYGPRPTRDDTIRPGEIREFYRTRARVLAESPSYRFQDLVVTVDQVGGAEPARALAEELRGRLEAGEDFAALHEEYGTTYVDTGGVTPLFGPDNPIPDPAMRRFAEESELGAVSPVYPLSDPRRQGAVVAFRVLVLYERSTAPPPPPFAEAETQELIRKAAGRNRDEVWLGVAREGLSQRSFLWFNDHGTPGSPARNVAGSAAQDGPQAASATLP